MANERDGMLRVPTGEGRSERPVSWRVVRPRGAHTLLVLAHGAGAGMHHPFMESLVQALSRQGVASFRYQFPYMEQGSRRPDSRRLLLATVRAAVGEARRRVRGLRVLVGGKSMGGRMTSLAMSEVALVGVEGIVFVGFPLHPAGKPGDDRAAHLADVRVPMLFLQGTRDRLAELSRIRRVCRGIGSRTQLHEIEDADHGFHVPKRTGRGDADVIDELAAETARFAGSIRASRAPR